MGIGHLTPKAVYMDGLGGLFGWMWGRNTDHGIGDMMPKLFRVLMGWIIRRLFPIGRGEWKGWTIISKCTTKVEAANRFIILDSKLLSSPTLSNARRPAEALLHVPFGKCRSQIDQLCSVVKCGSITPNPSTPPYRSAAVWTLVPYVLLMVLAVPCHISLV
jgi:hypothetical protein